MIEQAWPFISVFLRGWLLVTLVACNTVQISRQNYTGAVLVGFLISLTWWYNAHSASVLTGHIAALVYGSGAALGTATGMFVGSKFVREGNPR